MLGRFVFIVCFINPVLSRAEFRAFRLKIVNSETGMERIVTTRFDDLQYADYHPIQRSERISIDQTWMCYERNDYTGIICSPPSKPKDNSPDIKPATQLR
jgi:hypothetical protein